MALTASNFSFLLGCDSSRYTPACNKLCPYQCKNQQCDVYNGSCIYGCSHPSALTLDCIGNIDSNVSSYGYK